MLSAADLVETVRRVELDRRKRRVHVDAGCAGVDRVGFGRSEQRGADPELSGRGPDVDGRAMLVAIDPCDEKPNTSCVSPSGPTAT
jgi:hypothetical protein